MSYTLKIKNRTNFFDPSRTKLVNEILNPVMFHSKRMKIENYENRLYFEFLNTQKKNGSTFFYTLTYNDKSVPKYDGHNVFNYDDLRDLLNGAFVKMLLRKYHCHMKYFVGSELGEGAGKRGYANNPHYHCLFFVVPEFGYDVISPEDFKGLIEDYWQGFREGHGNYRDAKYGIACPGDDLGFVKSFQACYYCAKYVSKDANMRSLESLFLNNEYVKYSSSCENNDNALAFIHTLNKSDVSDTDFLKSLYEQHSERFQHDSLVSFAQELAGDLVTSSVTDFRNFNDWYCKTFYFTEYQHFLVNLCEDYVRKKFTEFRNRHSNKVRISQKVGDYALEFIDPMNPFLELPTKKGNLKRSISGYYYRKLYYDVVKDPVGQNIYVLNDLGFDYKRKSLLYRINSHVNRSLAIVEYASKFDFDVFARYVVNDLKDSLFPDTSFDLSYESLHCESKFPQLRSTLDFIISNKFDVVRRYAEYKLVYEGRSFILGLEKYTGELLDHFTLPDINVVDDYSYFISPVCHANFYNPSAVDGFYERGKADCYGYSLHPYFHGYIMCFDLLDLLSDYYNTSLDAKDQAEYEEMMKFKKFFSVLTFNSTYGE